MWESWLVLSLPFAIWSGVVAARFLGRRLALWRLKRLTHHRSRLELAWDLLRTIPRECLTTDLRKAAGKMLRHHLAACANGKARRTHELRIARFVGGSTPLTWARFTSNQVHLGRTATSSRSIADYAMSS